MLKLVVLQVVEGDKPQPNLQKQQRPISSNREPQHVLCFLCKDFLVSQHPHRLVSLLPRYLPHVDDVLYYFIAVAAVSVQLRLQSVHMVRHFQIITPRDQMHMIRQIMTTMIAAPCVQQIAAIGEDEELNIFHCFHLKQLLKVFLVAHFPIYIFCDSK